MIIKERNSFFSASLALRQWFSLSSVKKNQNPFELKFSSFLLTEKKTALLTKSDIILKCLQQLQMYNFFFQSMSEKKSKCLTSSLPVLLEIYYITLFFFIIKNSTIFKQKNFFCAYLETATRHHLRHFFFQSQTNRRRTPSYRTLS